MGRDRFPIGSCVRVHPSVPYTDCFPFYLSLLGCFSFTDRYVSEDYDFLHLVKFRVVSEIYQEYETPLRARVINLVVHEDPQIPGATLVATPVLTIFCDFLIPA
ncbi:hypothetical protein ABKN59_001566 [Abortiporus biennis]